jgi:cytochrome c oxidase subunit III
MATYIPSSPVDTARLGRGGNPPAPPSGGDEDGPGASQPNYGSRLRRARLGMICAIATVCMIFISLTSAYVVRQGMPTYDDATRTYLRDWGEVQLPWILLAINTTLLVLSSITIEASRRGLARQAALSPVKSIPGVSLGNERRFPWLGITVLLGLGFLIGQWMAWGELHNGGFYLSTNPNSSFVFLLTATHAVHLMGGIIALIWATGTSLLGRPIESQRIVVDVTAWYWHFMAFLWVYIFALLVFAR